MSIRYSNPLDIYYFIEQYPLAYFFFYKITHIFKYYVGTLKTFDN